MPYLRLTFNIQKILGCEQFMGVYNAESPEDTGFCGESSIWRES